MDENQAQLRKHGLMPGLCDARTGQKGILSTSRHATVTGCWQRPPGCASCSKSHLSTESGGGRSKPNT